MKNSQLVATLSSLDKKEVRELRKWLHSPVHNQREDVIDLFEYLCNSKRLEKPNLLEKEKVFRKIFPREPYDDARFRQTIHFLLKVMEEFLVYSEMRDDEVRQRTVLASVYRKRKLTKVFQRTIKQVEALQQKTVYKDENHLRNAYLLQREKYNFWVDSRQKEKVDLQDISDALDYAFLADKLKQSCLFISHLRFYKTELNTGLIDEVLNYIESHQDVFQIPAITIYYHVYKALTSESQDSEIYFQDLRATITQHGHLFSNEEIREVYLMAINYCIQKVNKGERSFIRESFNMYKEGFEKGYLIENNFVSHYTFHNVVAFALMLKEYHWAKHFIDTYQQYLDVRHRSNTVVFSLARLHFIQKEYDQSMRLLAQTEFNEVVYNLQAKTMLLKMYYEQMEEDALESLLESMRAYINRKEIVVSLKSNVKNIIRMTKKLNRINPYDREQREKLRNEIKRTHPLGERAWLLEQLDAL